jgi:hypothetical protein
MQRQRSGSETPHSGRNDARYPAQVLPANIHREFTPCNLVDRAVALCPETPRDSATPRIPIGSVISYLQEGESVHPHSSRRCIGLIPRLLRMSIDHQQGNVKTARVGHNMHQGLPRTRCPQLRGRAGA